MKNHKAKKSLGQNFLKSNLALNKIIEAGEINKKDIILEIGPGKGALTEKLLEKASVVIAVEKDKDLIILLNEKFEKEIKNKKLILLEDDILKININNIISKKQDYKIIANIPYNITGAILKKFLTEEKQPERMVLMLQYEVAKRILGKNTQNKEKESLLSISVKAYGEPKFIMKVEKKYFSPSPKVDSAIISIKNISRNFFIKNKIDEEKFWKIVKNGFSHKRKKLGNNLKNEPISDIGNINKVKYLNKRAEELSLIDWLNLIR